MTRGRGPGSGPQGPAAGPGGAPGAGTPWWETAVFYQIYPRSFKDSDGDGVGDLGGICDKLDYLAWLGVDALWISPFYPSPMRDFGYDVSDYRGVDPLFGNLDDFRRLLAGAKARGLRVVLDLVVNHSSDEHPWFVEARSSRTSPKHPRYLWVPDSGRPPNNWKAVFELGSAWHPNPATGERYLGTFTRHQPEFDWRNPELREAVYDLMRYWYGLGVDGFRLDVATAYLKDPALRSNPPSLKANPDFFQRHLYDRNLPEVFGIFREMRALADGWEGPEGASLPGERVLIGEPYGWDPQLAAFCCGREGEGLHLAFNFDFLNQGWDPAAFRGAAERWYAALGDKAWPDLCLSNHDQPRHAWRYRAGEPAATEARAKVAAALLLTLRGSPFLYYGEEIGMSCARLRRKELRDPLGVRTWPLRSLGRDPERTPMQWDSSAGAGFTAGKPWLPLNPDHAARNVEAQSGDPDSILSWYRRLIDLRRSSPALLRGSLTFIDGLPRRVLGYRREAPREAAILVLLNFGDRREGLSLEEDWELAEGSHRGKGGGLRRGELGLEAGECLVLRRRGA